MIYYDKTSDGGIFCLCVMTLRGLIVLGEVGAFCIECELVFFVFWWTKGILLEVGG